MYLTTKVAPFSTTPTAPFIQGTPYAQRNQQYTDSTRNKREGMSIKANRIAAAMRRDRAAQLRALATLELLEGAK